MNFFILRVLSLTNRFYKRIESDTIMQFEYTLFAFAMYIVFYLWGLLLWIYLITRISLLKMSYLYFLYALPVFMLIYLYLYRNKIKVLKDIERSDNISLGIKDIFVLAYVFMSFPFFYFSVIWVKSLL